MTIACESVTTGFVSTPHSRLRLTRRGRAVFTALAVVPASVVIGVMFTFGGAVASSSAGADTIEYVQVAGGQSLWEIASAIAPGADPREVVSDLVHLNQLTGFDVQAGQQLAVPSQYAD